MKLKSIITQLFLFLFLTAAILACSQNDNKQEKEASYETPAPPEKKATKELQGALNKSQFDKYINNYKNEDTDNLKTIVNGSYSKMEYKLYDEVKEDFFTYINAHPNSQLQIHLGLDDSKSKIVPLLAIVSCSNDGKSCDLKDKYYSFKQTDNYSIEEANKCSEEEKKNEVLSYGCAGYLENSWINRIKAEEHGEYLLTKSGDGNTEKKVRYYTFKSSVTETIKKYGPEGKDISKIDPVKSYFTMHISGFTKDEDSDTVAKMVIHVHYQGKDGANSGPEKGESRGFYEFASPCPAYCPDNSINDSNLQ